MSGWRAWGPMGWVAAAVVCTALYADETTPACELVEAMKAGDCFRIQLDTKLTGEMRFQKPSGTLPMKQEMTASHLYSERVLVADKGLAQKSARAHETAKASFVIGEERFEKVLRPERRLLIAQRAHDQGMVYCPAGPLTRAELEVGGDHLDTLAVAQLLPGKSVHVGETWKVASPAVQAACNFEGLTEHALTGKFDSVGDGVAVFSLTGTATGIDTGALVKATIEASGKFDLKTKRIVELKWKQKDERDQGPASPAMTAETTVTLRREAIEQPDSLSDVALVSVPEGLEVPTQLAQLDHHDPAGRYALVYSRDWALSSLTKDHLVLRLMDKGDFVAQVTITPWTAARKGAHVDPKEFKEKINDTTGWQPEKELQAEEVPGQEGGRYVYRLTEEGKLDDLPVVQTFYLVAAPSGEQMVLAFTMTPKQVQKLGDRDVRLVNGLEVPAK